MKIAVIYASKSGFTKKYATWLSEVLSGELLPLNEVTAAHLRECDLLLYGGGLYAGGINGLKKFNALAQGISKDKIIYFATGATPPREEVAPELIQGNFPLEEQNKIQFFYLRGGFDNNLLGMVDRILMSLFKRMIKRKKAEDRTPDESGMLAAYDHPVDFTNIKHIEPIIACVQTKASKLGQE